MAVHLNRPPHSVRLVAWGRADDGWWGCIQWRQRVVGETPEPELPVAAWVPAGALSLPGWSTPREVPRMILPQDRRRWPSPPGWPSWFAGVWADGPLALPIGVRAVTGAAWRHRRAK